MKQYAWMLALGLTLFLAAPISALDLGDTLPGATQRMVATDGKTYRLADVAKENGLIVMFTCNTCPYVHAWENRYNKISAWAKENNVGFIALNSNERLRSKGESMKAMKRRATSKNYDFIYAVDKNNMLADAFDAYRTPEIFIFNHKSKLVYTGSIDDNYRKASKVKNHYVKNALDALGRGEVIKVAQTKSLGCSIKRAVKPERLDTI